jgi:hypothetical protein
MIITPLDSQNNLFKVIDILPIEIAQTVINTDWLALPWERQYMQERWPRRKVNSNDVTPLMDQYLSDNVDIVAEAIGVKLSKTLITSFWVDEPGIENWVPPHLDNPAVKVILHTYWTEQLTDVGTTFYNDAEATSIRYIAPHVNNTGYILKNHDTAWHGISPGKVTSKCRVGSYTYFSYPN